MPLREHNNALVEGNTQMLPGITNRNDFGGDFERIVNLRNRTGEERRRQNLCDKRDNNFV